MLVEVAIRLEDLQSSRRVAGHMRAHEPHGEGADAGPDFHQPLAKELTDFLEEPSVVVLQIVECQEAGCQALAFSHTCWRAHSSQRRILDAGLERGKDKLV
jgi:hypothetical protein